MDDLILQNESQFQNICRKMKKLLIKKQALALSEPVEILPGLLLGNYSHALNKGLLQNKKITMVLSCLPINNRDKLQGINYLQIIVRDKENESIQTNFNHVYTSIHNHIASSTDLSHITNKCLVNCFSGKSRSPTLVLSYLIRSLGMDFESAFELLKKKYPAASPNKGFIEKLKVYAEEIQEENRKRGEASKMQSQLQLQREKKKQQDINLLENSVREQQEKSQVNLLENTIVSEKKQVEVNLLQNSIVSQVPENRNLVELQVQQLSQQMKTNPDNIEGLEVEKGEDKINEERIHESFQMIIAEQTKFGEEKLIVEIAKGSQQFKSGVNSGDEQIIPLSSNSHNIQLSPHFQILGQTIIKENDGIQEPEVKQLKIDNTPQVAVPSHAQIISETVQHSEKQQCMKINQDSIGQQQNSKNSKDSKQEKIEEEGIQNSEKKETIGSELLQIEKKGGEEDIEQEEKKKAQEPQGQNGRKKKKNKKKKKKIQEMS